MAKVMNGGMCQQESPIDPRILDPKEFKNIEGLSSKLVKSEYELCVEECNTTGMGAFTAPVLTICYQSCKNRPHQLRRDKGLARAIELRDLAMRGEITDFEALALTADYLSQFPNVTGVQVINDLSYIFTGLEGPGTFSSALMRLPANILGLDYPPINSGLSSGQMPFGDNPLGSGLHSDYEDYNNQIYHFIPHAASVVDGTNIGSMLAYAEIVAHEDWGFPDAWRGLSWQDKNLSLAGIGLGLLVHQGSVAPKDIGDWIRTTLKQPSPFGTLSQPPDDYAWINICRPFGDLFGFSHLCRPSVPYPSKSAP